MLILVKNEYYISRPFQGSTSFSIESVYCCVGVLILIVMSLSNGGYCQGKQEDAEEFLGSILDGLHEEMVEAKEAVKTPENDADSNGAGEGNLNLIE